MGRHQLKKDKQLSNPRRVAREVIAQASDGKKINLSKAMKNVGYAKNSRRIPKVVVTEKEDFKDEIFDFVKEMETERKLCLKELKDPKVRKKATYRDRIDAINKLTNNIQLVTGQTTSNEVMTIIWDDEGDK